MRISVPWARPFVWTVLATAALLCCTDTADAVDTRPLQQLLFDFEVGVDGWLGNPWGGGNCGQERVADAALGDGCLRGWYRDVEKGANVICPYFAKDAAWRELSWGGLSLYVRGDGSPAKITVILETDEEQHATYSKSLALQDTSWHRVCLPFSTFWNRGRQRFAVARLQRLYFGCSGTHEFFIDHVQLEAPYRTVPLRELRTVTVPPWVGTVTIDGASTEPAWTAAVALEPFVKIDGSALAQEQTACRVLHDGNTLFISADLHTAAPDKLKATLTRHDASVWTEDAFEIFITGDAPDVRFYQFAVNLLGTRAELSTRDGVGFTHDWRAAASRTGTGWQVEVALPLASLVKKPGPGVTFGVNLARENRVTGELSCWSPTGQSFLRPERFGRAVLWGTRGTVVLPVPDLRDYGNGVYAAPSEPLAAARSGAGPRQTWRTTLRLPAVAQLSGEATLLDGDRPAGAPLMVLAADQRQEGEALAEFLLADESGRPLAYQAGAFRVYLPPPSTQGQPALPLTPSPKELTLAEGTVRIPRDVEIVTGGSEAVDERVTHFLTRELKRWYGVATTRRKDESHTPGGTSTLTLQARQTARLHVSSATLSPSLVRRLEGIPAEGYVLEAKDSRVIIAARDAAGLYYGAQTLLQAIDLSSDSPSQPQIPFCTIVDWPSLTWRAVSHPLPTSRWGHPNDAPVSADFFCDYIERFMARRKFNALILLTRQGVTYETHPEITGPAAWSQEELRRVIETCREHFIEPIPLVDSYGHAAWMSLSHKELWEDGNHTMVCPRHPDTFRILTDVYGELIDLFSPTRYFHIGLDEVWWKTLDIPEEKRCTRCAGVPKWELFADQTTRLHSWLKERGARTMMWSDVLLTEHNGGAPYHGAKALTMLPTDIVQTNWSITLASGSNQRLQNAGYEVWQSNSHGVNREQAQFCTGNMFGAWAKISWWSQAPWRSGGSYSYLNLPVAGEYSWNLWPEVDSTQPSLTRAELARHAPGALFREACDPEPNASENVFTIPLSGNMSTRAAIPSRPDAWFGSTPEHDLQRLPRGTVSAGRTSFTIADAALDCVVAFGEQGGVMIPVGFPVASLRFLHTTRLVPEHETAFFENFKRGANWRGIPAGRYVVHYADGATSTCPILYVNNTSRWELGDQFPYVYRSCGALLAATESMFKENPDGRDVCLYVAQWVNPRPHVTVEALELIGTDQATPVLFAITGRTPRE